MGIEECQRGRADYLMQRVAVDARRIDAALGEIVLSLLVAFIGEDLVVDPAGNDVEFGSGMFAAKAAFSAGGVWVSAAPTMR